MVLMDEEYLLRHQNEGRNVCHFMFKDLNSFTKTNRITRTDHLGKVLNTEWIGPEGPQKPQSCY